MPTNVLLNQSVSASSYVLPYAPSRVVDGVLNQPTNRWLCNQVPGWIMADLGSEYYVNRWVVRMLPTMGWQTPDYCLSTLQLQGSMDGSNWTTIDSVSGNTSSIVDRTFPPVTTRFVRLWVAEGLRVNPSLASLVEWELYDTPQTENTLTSLITSSGTLEPSFDPFHLSYSENVGFDVESITVIPTAQDPQAQIQVNGVEVPQSTASSPIDLLDGEITAIEVQVIPQRGTSKSYMLSVLRASNPYLASLQVLVGKSALGLQPPFSSNEVHYSANAPSGTSRVMVKPVAVDSNALVTVNGTPVTASAPSVGVSITGDSIAIDVCVKSAQGIDERHYSILVNNLG